MGYYIDLNVVAQKATDYSDLSGVKLTVFHEGENFSIAIETTNENGTCYIGIDRYHWQENKTKRIKIFFEKAGYVSGCVKATYEGETENNAGWLQTYTAHILLVEAEPEVIPPPIEEPVVAPPEPLITHVQE